MIDPRHTRQNQRDCVDNARNIIRQSQQRWDRRLAVEDRGFSFSDDYLQGRLWFAIELNGPWRDGKVKLLARIRAKVAIVEDGPAVSIRQGDSDQAADGDQEPMFIEVGKLIEGPQGFVPSIVSAYLIDDEVVERLGDGLLFRSLLNGAYKSLPFVADREKHLTAALDIGPCCRRIAMIQRRAEIGYGISKDEGKLWSEWLTSELNRVRISIDAKRVSIRRNISGESFEFADVLFGPFNL